MRRVLLVDDDRSMVKTLEDVLSLKGWTVQTAFSGEEAVAVATSEPFDIVLMDVRMPGMDGVDAIKAIRKHRPDMPAVFMTAYAAQDRLVEAEQAGRCKVLSKPVNVAALLELLANGLDEARPVVLMDNDVTFLKTMSDVLELKGYTTVPATSIEDAIRLMAQQKPVAVMLHTTVDAIVLRNVVRRMHDAMPSAAVILYSGRSQRDAELDLGATVGWVRAYLRKPFAIEQVTQLLDDIRRLE